MTTLRLPLVDLHRHLDGNVRVSTILALAQEHKLPLPSTQIDTLEKLIYIQDKTSNLLEFLQKLDYGVSVLANIDACQRIAFENVEDAYNEGLAYVELRFSPFYMAQSHKLALTDVVGAVVTGIDAATAMYPVKVKLIGIMSRTFGEEACMRELQALLAHHESIAGLDLAGDEYNFPGKRFVEHFALARTKTDWRYTIHAGEADGASSVWDAIHLLHADRIGHGVRAVEDPALIDYLKEHEIGIESCLTSNYQTGTWTDVASHPLKSFLENGVIACLNTDDPGVSNISLQDEFDIAQTVLKLSSVECDTLQKNAIKMAFLGAEEKSMLLSQQT